jgi:hypothetical protein
MELLEAIRQTLQMKFLQIVKTYFIAEPFGGCHTDFTDEPFVGYQTYFADEPFGGCQTDFNR